MPNQFEDKTKKDHNEDQSFGKRAETGPPSKQDRAVDDGNEYTRNRPESSSLPRDPEVIESELKRQSEVEKGIKQEKAVAEKGSAEKTATEEPARNNLAVAGPETPSFLDDKPASTTNESPGFKRLEHDSSDRKAFNKQWRDAASSGEAPLLESLTDSQGKAHNQTVAWRDPEGKLHPISPPGFYTDPKDENATPGFVKTSMDASHATFDDSGKNNLSIESSTTNRSRGTLEKSGVREDVPSVTIDGWPMAKETAENLEKHGVFPSGTVEKAPPTLGWTRESGNLVQDSAEKSASDKAAAEKALSEKAAAEKSVSDNAAAEKALSEKAAAEKSAAEKAAIEKASAEKSTVEKDSFGQTPSAEKSAIRELPISNRLTTSGPDTPAFLIDRLTPTNQSSTTNPASSINSPNSSNAQINAASPSTPAIASSSVSSSVSSSSPGDGSASAGSVSGPSASASGTGSSSAGTASGSGTSGSSASGGSGGSSGAGSASGGGPGAGGASGGSSGSGSARGGGVSGGG